MCDEQRKLCSDNTGRAWSMRGSKNADQKRRGATKMALCVTSNYAFIRHRRPSDPRIGRAACATGDAEKGDAP